MATVDIPHSNTIPSGSFALPNIDFPKTKVFDADPTEVVNKWTASFNALLKGALDASDVFLEDSYWRDLLCQSWNFHTSRGPPEITSWRIKRISVDESSDFRRPKVGPLDYSGELKCVQSFITVETDVGKGWGLVRLLEDNGWKAYTLFTTLQELHGFPELTGAHRPRGTDFKSQPGRQSWSDRRGCELKPAVLVVDAGQAGLTIAARLGQLGVPTLVVDRFKRVGDNWRNRYHHLVLHDAVWFDHMPYLNFPPQWPVFTPKNKLADWFESYANIMELNVWTETTVKSAKWDKGWTVELEGANACTVTPQHVVLATGASGRPSIPPIPGLDSFAGRLIHSSEFHGCDNQNKSVVVIGSCNSAHDIAQDYQEHGYNVTMVQRSSTHVVASQTLVDVTMAGLYCEGGPPTEDADIINHSFPWPVLKRFHTDATLECARRDSNLLQSLQSAGFTLDSGPDGAGLWTKYLSRGGGYYIDTGASELIASGKIKVRSASIDRVTEHGAVLDNGEILQADEIVLATGYGNMRETAGQIFGKELEDKLGDVWGFDAEGETRGMWRRSEQEGFWFHGGNLALCRFYSKSLALQIKAMLEGLYRFSDA